MSTLGNTSLSAEHVPAAGGTFTGAVTFAASASVTPLGFTQAADAATTFWEITPFKYNATEGTDPKMKKWGFGIGAPADPAGSLTRKNRVFCFGYNVGASNIQTDSADASFGIDMESFWNPSGGGGTQRWFEQHMFTVPAGGSSQIRAWSINYQYSTAASNTTPIINQTMIVDDWEVQKTDTTSVAKIKANSGGPTLQWQQNDNSTIYCYHTAKRGGASTMMSLLGAYQDEILIGYPDNTVATYHPSGIRLHQKTNAGGTTGADIITTTWDGANVETRICDQAANRELAFFGATPVGQTSAYTVTNPSTDRGLNVSADTTAQVAAVLGTLIADLKAFGLLG